MSEVELGLVAQLVLTATAILAGLFVTPRRRALVAGGCVAAVGGAGAVTGAVVLPADRVASTCRQPCPSIRRAGTEPARRLLHDGRGLVGAVTAVYAIGYATARPRRERPGPRCRCSCSRCS